MMLPIKKPFSFSLAQQKALNLKRQNMLISAGAGSGKTAVLVERLYRIVTEKNVELDALLVLTFTKAGALEFKKRIREKLEADEKEAHKVLALDGADITTFDAYALKIVRKYGYHLGISSNIINLDQKIEKIMIRRYFDEIMQEMYLNPTTIFTQFTRRFLLKNDEPLFALIESFWNTANLQIDPESYASNYLETYYNNQKFSENYQDLNTLVITTIRNIAANIKQLSNEKHLLKYEPFLAEYGAVLSFDDFMATKALHERPSVPPKSAENNPEDIEYVERIKAYFDDIKEFIALESKSKMYECFKDDASFAAMTVDIYQKISSRMNEFKKMRNAYTFSDIARFALSLVDRDDVAYELQQQYAYILIDEYQDTSDIQEAFIARISDNNVYMVGDIKQSIYAFRNANSDIFQAKYNDYAKDHGGELVVLNDNYRSRKEVLSAINKLLSTIMSKDYGGADYAINHVIGYGNNIYDTHQIADQKVGLMVYNYDPMARFNEVTEDGKRGASASLSRQEYEADIVVNDIKTKLASGYMIFDDVTKVMRKAEYRDFTLLVDSSTHFEAINHRFTSAGIPLFIDRNEAISSDKVNIAVKNMLKIMLAYSKEDEPTAYEFRFAVASFLRSFVNNYTDQKLLDLFQDKTTPFSDDPVLAQLKDLAHKSKTAPLTHVFLEALTRFKMYDAIFTIGDLSQNTFKLSAKSEEISNLVNLGFNLEEIVNYFDELEDNKVKIEIERPKLVDNAVTLMTIHHSKGLEFPVVYYLDLMRDFYRREKINKLEMDDKYGLITPLSSSAKSYVVLLKLNKNIQTILSEKIRLLYVALTRARELMVVIHPSVEEEKIPAHGKEKNFVHLLLKDKNYRESITLYEQQDDMPYKKPLLPKYTGKDKISLKTINYPFSETLKDTKIKLQHDASEALLQRGTLLHRYIELYDFETKKLDYIPSQEDRYHIKTFFELPLFDGANATNVYREYEYLDEKANTTFIIDFFVVMSRKILLLDFKLYNIEEQDYTEQISNYATHLRKAFNKPVEAHLVSILTFKTKEVVNDDK